MKITHLLCSCLIAWPFLLSNVSAQKPEIVKKTFTYKTVGDLEIKLDVHRADDDSVRPVAVNIHGGALIMGGRFDRICPPINQTEISAVIPGAELVIFEKSGHAPFTEEPLRFLGVVQDFLRGLEPAR